MMKSKLLIYCTFILLLFPLVNAQTQEFSIDTCPTETFGSIGIWILALVSLFFILMALIYDLGFVGVFGSAMLIITSLFISTCFNTISVAVGLSGMMLVVFFSLKKNLGFRNETFNKF